MVFQYDPGALPADSIVEPHALAHLHGGVDEIPLSLEELPSGDANTVLVGNGADVAPSYSGSPTITGLVVIGGASVGALTVGDVNFAFSIVSGNPRITLESGNYFEFVRASNIFRFALGSTALVEIDANGQLQLKVNGSTGGIVIGDTQIYRDGADILRTPDKFKFDAEIEIDGAFNHDGALFGVYGATPVSQGTGGENVTNSVTDSGSTAGVIPDFTDGAVWANDSLNVRRALFQLARIVKQDHDQLRANGYLS